MPVVAINLGGAPTVKQAQAPQGRLNPPQGNPTGQTSRAFVTLGMPNIYVWVLQRVPIVPGPDAVVTLFLDGCVRAGPPGGGPAPKARETWEELTSVVLVPGIAGTVIPRFFFPGMKVRLRMTASDVGSAGAPVPVDYILAASG